jgi:outer membrane murein-binding lipoprotein Lpp
VAKTKRDEDLFKMMRAAGVRKKVAAEISDAVGQTSGPGDKAPKIARQAVRDFSALAARLEDRVSAGAPKRAAAGQKRARAPKRTSEPQRKGGQGASEAPTA